MSPEAELMRDAIGALALYPTGGLAGAVAFLGGTKATAALLLPPKQGHSAKTPRPGIGPRQVQLYLAHERRLAGDPSAPKIHKPIPKTQRQQLNRAVNEKALQLVIVEMRKRGLLCTVEAWMKISEKAFLREMGKPPVLISHEQRDDANRSLLTLLCDAASKHLWDACYGFWEIAFFKAYQFEGVEIDWDTSEGVVSMALALPKEPLARQS